MLSKKKKILILSSMIVLLVVTGWLNIVLTNNGAVDAGTGGGQQGTGNFFTDSRADRLEIRNKTILILDSILANESTDEESFNEATRQKLFLTSAMMLEPEIEMLIQATEGVDDCLVTIGTSNISVIVKCEEYTDEIVSSVFTIIREKTGKTTRYVNITPI